MKNIMFIAPPAAGKGTQAELVTKKYNIPHISTGDILREISKEDSEIGSYVYETLASGKLVKDEITYKLIEERLNKEDCKVLFGSTEMENVRDLVQPGQFASNQKIIITFFKSS